MRVGIGLLTLVPGVVGGSETYARELVRALERVGAEEYRVFTPSIVGDVPGRPVRSYRAGRTMPRRTLAMAEALLRPGRLRRELGRAHCARRPRPARRARPRAAAGFTWAACARAHDEVYRRLVA